MLQLKWIRMLESDCGMRNQLVQFLAPTGHRIPAQGETLGTEISQWMRSEGTPQRG